MNDTNMAARAAEILRRCIYANIATCGLDGPWNTPVTALPDSDLTFYWSSWVNATHTKNVDGNGQAFLTFYDSTRARGTNNMMCLYLQCAAGEVKDNATAEKAFRLLYPNEDIDFNMFTNNGIKRFYFAKPHRAWLNCLSERELEPSTVKMRAEVFIKEIREQLL